VHANSECGFRKTVCKFNPLGCDWGGLAKEKRPHEKECPIRKRGVKFLLKKVEERNKQKAEEKKKLDEQAAAEKEVSSILGKRCRDIVFRDVLLERDVLSSEMCSKTFSALGFIWECVLQPRPKPEDAKNESQSSASNQTVNIFLRVVCSIKRPISFAMVVLPGPDLASTTNLRPTVHRTRLKRSKHKKVTPPFVLPFEKDQVDRVYEMDKINLRLGLIDLSNHRPSSSFFSGQTTGSPSDSDSDSMYSDADEDGLSIEITDDEDSEELVSGEEDYY